MIFYLVVLLVGIPGCLYWGLFSSRRSASAAESGSIFSINSPTPSITPTLQPTYTFQPTQTPQPTYTPNPTYTPIVGYLDLKIQYSYYWPPLLGPNCHPDNLDGQGGCIDTTSSGEKWSEWRYDGIAMPIEWKDKFPFGTRVRVVSPVEMAGDYTIVDLCGACIKPEYPDLIWFDFLDDTQRLPWSVDMQVQLFPPVTDWRR